MSASTPRVLSAKEGKSGMLRAIGVRFMINAADSGGGFSLVEHPMPPRALGAPLHRHRREDEYSFVLEGQVGVLLGEDVVYGEVGDLIFKPRNQWHTFWNAGNKPARILEIISPAGFERYFDEMIALPAGSPPDRIRIAEIAARYGLELDFASVPALLETYGLSFGPPAK